MDFAYLPRGQPPQGAARLRRKAKSPQQRIQLEAVCVHWRAHAGTIFERSRGAISDHGERGLPAKLTRFCPLRWAFVVLALPCGAPAGPQCATANDSFPLFSPCELRFFTGSMHMCTRRQVTEVRSPDSQTAEYLLSRTRAPSPPGLRPRPAFERRAIATRLNTASASLPGGLVAPLPTLRSGPLTSYDYLYVSPL